MKKNVSSFMTRTEQVKDFQKNVITVNKNVIKILEQPITGNFGFV